MSDNAVRILPPGLVFRRLRSANLLHNDIGGGCPPQPGRAGPSVGAGACLGRMRRGEEKGVGGETLHGLSNMCVQLIACRQHRG